MIRLRLACALAAGLMSFLAASYGALPTFKPDAAHSLSGQFIVSATPDNFPVLRRPDVSTNTALLRLEAPWLVVSAERFKAALWRELGLPPDSSWSGKIFVVLHTALTTNEPVIIASQPFINTWNYRLELPDLVNHSRYTRALSAVILLENANRRTPATGRLAEIPPWLADGLAQQVMEADAAKVIISAPTKTVDALSVTRSGPASMPQGMTLTRMSQDRRHLDPLISARQVLQIFPALTFDQLSWPNDAQLNAEDEGVYLASAQLFVSELLALKNGPAQMRAFLAQLPNCQNWQSAFFTAFRDQFRRPLDVEKWWALRVVNFVARAPGPQWTAAVSCQKLEAILRVPIAIRTDSNALPSRAEISLQAAVQSFAPPEQTEILRTKRRDLELVQFRLPPSLAAVAAGYENLLADFLGERKRKAYAPSTTAKPVWRSATATEALLIKLDALDECRPEIEARFDPPTVRLDGQ